MNRQNPNHAEIKQLLTFFANYGRLLELQLAEIRLMISSTVDKVMKDVERISQASEQKRKDANTALLETFVSPDAETKKIVVEIQDSVNDVFEQAMKQHADGKEITVTSSVKKLNDDDASKLRRAGARFTKHLEAIEKLDGELKEILFSMISALSNDDVIGQRLQHISLTLEDLRKSLRANSDIATSEQIENWTRNLVGNVYATYTTEEEKQVHKKVFGDFQNQSSKKKAS